MQNELSRPIDYRKNFTKQFSTGTVAPVIVSDIERDLQRLYNQDRKRIKSNSVEMRRHYDAWMRYRDLEKNNKELLDRMGCVVAALGEESFESLSSRGKDADDSYDEVAIVTGDEPLWKAIAAIAEVRPGIQVVELQHALQHFGHKATRSTIESALTTHKEKFSITTRGRRKYVSLKGA